MAVRTGLEPAISSLRGWRPNQLDEGTVWRYGPDSNRRITALQAVLLNLLSTVSYGWDSWIRTSVAGVKGQSLNRLAISQNCGDPRRARTGHCNRERVVS